MSGIPPVIGLPGMSSAVSTSARVVFKGGRWDYTDIAGGGYINGSLASDVSNSPDVTNLQCGLLMGKVTSTGLYANAVIGASTGALTSAGTTLASSAAIATEIVRRLGTTGTLSLTGPPTTNGTARTLTLTYSNANTSNGNITVTAPGVNEVQTMTFGASATGGSMRLVVPKANGDAVTTDAITWNGTDNTWLSNINTALDAATGVSGGIVASGAAPDDVITFTFSGTGYAAFEQPFTIYPLTFPTSVTTSATVVTTAGVDGRFVSGSLIGPVDGSQVPLTVIPDGYPIQVATPSGTRKTVGFPALPTGGTIIAANLINWPSDTGLQTWIQNQMNAYGKFVFDINYIPA